MNVSSHRVNLIKIPLLFLILSIVLITMGISCGGSAEEGGYDPNYKPAGGETSTLGGNRGASTGNAFFDPTKKKEPSADGTLSSTLAAKCELDSGNMKILCVAHRTSMKSVLQWAEDHTNKQSDQGIFEFAITNPTKSEIIVKLEECINTTCNQIEALVDVSSVAP